MRKSLRALAAIVLLGSSSAAADENIEGHMDPLPAELLKAPIELSCGITIREWRGTSEPNDRDVAKMEALCTKVQQKFRPFLASRGLKAPHSGRLVWNLAMLPDGSCYRCLNDTAYRFKYRFVKASVWGYTGRDERYTFMVSETTRANPSFEKIFVHEAFHAMSMFWGLYDSHSSNDHEKTAVDERLAVHFTKHLGY